MATGRSWLVLPVALLLAGCAAAPPPEPPPPPPLVKITAAETRLPKRGELPPLIGRAQTYRVVPKD